MKVERKTWHVLRNGSPWLDTVWNLLKMNCKAARKPFRQLADRFLALLFKNESNKSGMSKNVRNSYFLYILLFCLQRGRVKFGAVKESFYNAKPLIGLLLHALAPAGSSHRGCPTVRPFFSSLCQLPCTYARSSDDQPHYPRVILPRYIWQI